MLRKHLVGNVLNVVLKELVAMLLAFGLRGVL